MSGIGSKLKKKLNGESEGSSLKLSRTKQKTGCNTLSRNSMGNLAGENHLEADCFQMWPLKLREPAVAIGYCL